MDWLTGKLFARLVFSGFALLLGAVGCEQLQPVDTRPLVNVGMSPRTIDELRALRITPTEVAELVKVKNAGASEQACVELVRIEHGYNRPFASGDAVVSLRHAGMSDETILELDRIDQLGTWVSELQTMRRVGISDPAILALAHLRAAGRPILSGSSLARLKNAGMSEEALVELVRRGVPDSQVDSIVALRWQGRSDAEILRLYPAR